MLGSGLSQWGLFLPEERASPLSLQLKQHIRKEKEGNIQKIFYLEAGLEC